MSGGRLKDRITFITGTDPGHPMHEVALSSPLGLIGQPEDIVRVALFLASDDAANMNAADVVVDGWQSVIVTALSGKLVHPGWSVRDDALMIDLSAMRELTHDETTQIATASPAVRGGLELAPFLAERGRLFTGGHCESVGIGGFLLQGGQGWNSRRWGWACENVLAIDVVTADGELVRANNERNADLFWAARGAGAGFFGVVTRLHLRTYPGQPMFHDTRLFALDDLEPLLDWLHEVLPTLDVAVEPVVAATRLPDVPLDPGTERPAGAVLLVHTTVFTDTEGEADRLLAPLDACPLLARGPTSIAEENVVQRTMAFSLEANVYLATYAIWTDPSDDERLAAWVTGHHARLSSAVGEGVYLGDSDFSRRPDRFLTDEHFRRLQGIRAVRDPEDRFINHLTVDGAVLNEASG